MAGMSPDVVFVCFMTGYVAWRGFTTLNARRRVPQWLENGAQVVDVRSPTEYEGGHPTGSVNIPLGDLARRAEELDPARPVIVCCATGARSAVARSRLRRLGFARVLNAGPWRNLP
jgi:rhodanese-related sulfurtransferase